MSRRTIQLSLTEKQHTALLMYLRAGGNAIFLGKDGRRYPRMATKLHEEISLAWEKARPKKSRLYGKL